MSSNNNVCSQEKVAWFKNLLQIKNRIKSPEPKEELNNSIDTLPFDLSEDFHKILEENRAKQKKPNMSKDQLNENKENNVLNTIYNDSKHLTIDSKTMFHKSVLEETGSNKIRNKNSALETTTNDSFLYLEKICDKSVTDPDSTLHSYVSQMKKGNSINGSETTFSFDKDNDECEAINRLLNECDITNNMAGILKERAEKYTKRSLNINEETQLGDIEAPSTLWDTIDEDEYEKMSPTKRVHLFRQSTILEESHLSDDTNNFTFQTANQQSTQYETANESFSSRYNNVGAKCPIENQVKTQDLISLDESQKDNLNYKKKNENETLLQDKYFNRKQSNSSTGNSELLESGIGSNNSIGKMNFENTSIKDESNIIEVLDDTSDSLNLQISTENNSLNLDETFKLDENEFNVSGQFDNTLEEIEYLMKLGEKSKNNGAKPKIISDIEVKINESTRKTKSPIPWLKEKNQLIRQPITNKPSLKSEIKLNSPQLSHRTKFDSPITKRNPITNIKSPSTPLYTNSTEKNDVFKKPIAGTKNTQSKKKFANIISPVGAYIKRTAETPIYTTVKSTTVKSLDYRAIARRIQYAPEDDKTFLNRQKQNVKCALPKKAYLSAEYHNIKDERTPIIIPGGEKIHRYLGPALLPQVVRHDGRVKMDFINENNDINASVDSSLADLSLMSGNVSLYTMKNAQNFASNKPKVGK